MWNFNDAGSLELSPESEWVGSILAPETDIRSTQSINGRVYVGGNFTSDGLGNEVHAFPWNGCASPVDVVPAVSVTITPIVDYTATGSATVGDDEEFIVKYQINDGPVLSGAATLNNPLVVEGLFEGDIVTIISQSQPLIDGINWTEPVLDEPLILVAGDDNRIEILNPAKANQVVAEPGTNPSDGSNDESGDLAMTGTSALPLGVLTLLTLMARAGLLVGARRRV